MSDSKVVQSVSDQEFEGRILESKGVALVDFWAEWCGPCRAIGPVVDELAEEFQGKASVFKMNVDENPKTPSRFQIRGIPTLLVFRDGKLVDQIVGAVPKETIAAALKSQLQ